MSIELFDVQCGFGGARAGDPAVVSAEALLREMGRLHISAALTRRVPDDRLEDVPASNAVLYAARDEHPSLIPCPVVVPSRGGSLPPEHAQVAAHVAQGCGAVSIRPAKDYWDLAPWVCHRLFDALQERNMPVFCLASDVSLVQVGDLAGRFPSLPIIVAGVHYRQQRILLPLLETFPGVHLSLGNCYTVHRGIEELVAKIGPERLLFGTGFPESEPMTAITQLMYADLTDDDRRLIGAANLRRLISEVAP